MLDLHNQTAHQQSIEHVKTQGACICYAARWGRQHMLHVAWMLGEGICVCAWRVDAHIGTVDKLEEDVLRRDGHNSVRRVEAHPFLYSANTSEVPGEASAEPPMAD